MSRCLKCGCKVMENDIYCANCGEKIVHLDNRIKAEREEGQAMKNPVDFIKSIDDKGKWKVALVIAGISSLLSLIAWSGIPEYTTGGFFMFLSLCGAFISYILAGGIGKAVKWAIEIAKWGWFLVPIFPIDIAFGIVAGLAGLLVFLLFPIVIVGKCYMERPTIRS